MNILVVNCGSSSLRSAILEAHSGAHIASLRVERIGEPEPRISVCGGDWTAFEAPTHAEALRAGLAALLEAAPAGTKIDAVGHRVVHGGEAFHDAVLIDDEVVATIESMIPLAPLHNPANLAGIRAGLELLPDVPHVASFDTAFHSTLPRRAKTYAIPQELAHKHHLRRFGFHGLSHEYVAKRAAEHLQADVRDLRLITCHLGNGCSVAAVEYGRSVETSMGMTPLEGLVMGTRSGDLDPGIIVQLMREEGLDVDGIDRLLNRESGLTGVSGVGNDMRDIERRASEGDEACRLAIQVFAHRVRKYIGAYAAVMGGVDAIVFTAGIGENSSTIRHRIAQRLDFLGAVLNEDANRDARPSHDEPVHDFSMRHSRCKLLAVKTNESLEIAREVSRVVQEFQATKAAALTIPVAVSARHIHLSQEAVEALFGSGYQLTERNPLSQPGQFACHETVTVVGPKRELQNVRVLGPVRSKTQVEISRTDEFFLGLDAPVRASGDVENTPGCTLIGTEGRRFELKQGVICAWRHIHMTPEDAEAFGVADKDVVEVRIDGTGRELVFGDVLVRVKPSYKLEMHIDTDEGNAAELGRGATGVLTQTSGGASIRRRGSRFDRV